MKVDNNEIIDSHVIENELSLEELKSQKSRSWFLVLPYPEKYIKAEDGSELDSSSICEEVVKRWCGNNEKRSCIAAYCISYQNSEEGYPHLHIVCCDEDMPRFTAVKKVLPSANIRVSRGTKAQIEDYIFKRGKYEDKNETVLCHAQKGEIVGRQGQRTDLKNIRDLVEQGYTPNQIFRSNVNYRRYEKVVKAEYFDLRYKNTPLTREVVVHWHVGNSGTGKSYTAQKLVDSYGRDSVYIVNNYWNGKFDLYKGEEILFLDEVKPDSFRLGELLSILDKYTNQIHCRYENAFMLWREVHLTSVYPPEELFKEMLCNLTDKKYDGKSQLLRRIHFIHYHYVENGEYKEFVLPMSEYSSLENLRYKADRLLDGFEGIEDLPIAK